MIKKCPVCNVEFECKHDTNCWCSKYTLTNRVSIYLKENYSDCLCEDCLRNKIQELG